MRSSVLLAIASAVLMTLLAAPASAQATRTWISGVGDDVNPCSRTAPCKTWAGAITKTNAGGEIDALDPGGFGTVTITKAITLDGGGGVIASVLASATDGIIVQAGASDVVILRNLSINGAGTTLGLNGIKFLSGAVLSVEHCSIFGFSQTGIFGSTGANATLNVFDTNMTNNASGIILAPTGGTLYGEMDNSTIQRVSNNGISTGGTFSTIFTVTRSNILNVKGVGVNSGGTGTVLGVDSSSISSNNTAFKTNGGMIRISRNTIYDNNVNYSINGGTIATTGDNVAAVNGATVPNGTVAHQ